MREGGDGGLADKIHATRLLSHGTRAEGFTVLRCQEVWKDEPCAVGLRGQWQPRQ